MDQDGILQVDRTQGVIDPIGEPSVERMHRKSTQAVTASTDETEYVIAWGRIVPFILLHLACGFVFVVGCSPAALIGLVVTFLLREFGLTAFYHRYFSHRAFKTSRWFQFVGACLGSAAIQRGPLWWAAHHRDHHRHSDHDGDVHSPHQHGFLWSHMGWFLTEKNYRTDYSKVKDFSRFPELVLLNRYDFTGPVLFGILVYGIGWWVGYAVPSTGTSGWQMLVWAFVVSTILLYHVTYAINSLAHTWGSRRFATDDDSRNNVWLALAAGGEGWHNNHHRFPASARQGVYWWEFDTTYYVLVVLSWFGVVWGLRQVPREILVEGRAGTLRERYRSAGNSADEASAPANG
ncbi:MAG: acyl-CoA desaturase [Planctomycetota bacterium]|nr:acyl-CoA desaturase [Planctomycetota bacterium]